MRVDARESATIKRESSREVRIRSTRTLARHTRSLVGMELESSPLRPTALAGQPSVDSDADVPGGNADYSVLNVRSVLNDARSRVFWLGLFLVGLWSAAFVIDAFEHVLQRNVELAHFVPLIIGHGGNAGSQTVGQVIKALATRSIDTRSRRVATRVVAKEAAVGALCGTALGAVVLIVGRVTRIVSYHVAWVVAISLPLVSLWANLIGAALPLLAARAGANPALTSAPLMTTIIDSSGLVIYFGVAQIYFWGRSYSDYVDKHHALRGHHYQKLAG